MICAVSATSQNSNTGKQIGRAPRWRRPLPLELLWGPASFEVQDAFFECPDSGVGVGVGGFDAVHAAEVAAREGFDTPENFGLHVSGAFGGALFGGGDGGGDSVEARSVVALHGGHRLDGLGEGFKAFVYGHACVLWRGWQSPVSATSPE